MWIFTPDSFISVVDKGDPTGQTLLVRARKAGDIERLFPEAKVQVGGGTDYNYRARIDREAVAQKVADQIRGINFPNFKNQVREHDRHDAYLGVWHSMYGFQNQNLKA
jgi:glycerol-3-phosphate dehydrogenase